MCDAMTRCHCGETEPDRDCKAGSVLWNTLQERLRIAHRSNEDLLEAIGARNDYTKHVYTESVMVYSLKYHLYGN
jgi:hypothetical protein